MESFGDRKEYIVLEKVKNTLEKYNMILPGEKIVIGVSGGADSMALLSILIELRGQKDFDIYAAHVEHGIRGQTSMEDASFVEALCKKWEIPFFMKRISAADMSKDMKCSLEQAGRVARYTFFQEVMTKINGHKIAVAHHIDDQAETILLHLFRGSGLKGLAGMEPVRQGNIIRPLLEVSRIDILDYCQRYSIPHVTDMTNFEVDYTRNRIRLKVIPYIQHHFNSEFVTSMAKMSDILRADENYMENETRKYYSKVVKGGGNGLKIEMEDFQQLHLAIKRRIIRLVIQELKGSMVDLELKHIDYILDLAVSAAAGSNLDIPYGIKVKKGYDSVHFMKWEPKKVDFCYLLNKNGSTEIPEMKSSLQYTMIGELPEHIQRHPAFVQYMDAEALPENTVLRTRKPGDRIRTLGSMGSKKLKEYFIDRKIERWERDSLPLLASGNNILWVIGYDISDDVKITDKTKKYLKMEFVPDNS